MTTVENPPTAKPLKFALPETFDTVEEERQHRKERLAGALRIFGRCGFSEGVAGHITACTPNGSTTSGSTRSV